MGSFILENTTTTVANTLLRAIHVNTRSAGFMSDLTNPLSVTPGIKIRSCMTNLYNDMLAHRLTMLPLGVQDLDAFNPANYECVLQVKNETAEVRHVRAGDFKVREKQADGSFVTLGVDATRAMFPPDPITGDTSLLVSLMPQRAGKAPEEVDLTAFPVVSTGKTNIAFSPVCQPSFGNTLDMDPIRREAFFSTWLAENKKLSDVRIITTTNLDAFYQEWVRTTDGGAAAAAASGQTDPVFITWLASKPIVDGSVLVPASLDAYRREWLTMAVQRCFIVDPTTGQPNSFTFKVESVGVRPVPDVVTEAIRSIVELVRPFADATTPGTELGLHVRPVDSRMNGLDVFIDGHEHTLGNLLQTLIAEESDELGSSITSISYKVPHPLDLVLQLRMGISPDFKGDTTELARTTIAAAASRAITVFEALGQNWATVVIAPSGLGAGAETETGPKKPEHLIFSDEE